jgi:hypothetical protein
MKKFLVAILLAAVAGAVKAQPAQQPSGESATSDAVNMEKLKNALTEKRRQLYAQGMSDLSPQQLEVFWGIYGDFEKEKNANMAARMNLVKDYFDKFSTLSDADLTKMLHEAVNLQQQGTDLRMKYFGILSPKIGARAAARFALIDDYLTTIWRLSILDNLPIAGGAAKN